MNKAQLLEDLTLLVKSLIPDIDDDCVASGDDDGGMPGIDITIGADADGWSYQTGDNSFTGGAYGYASWGISSIYRDSDPAAVARELVASLDEAHSDTSPPIWDAPVYAVTAGRCIERDGVRFVYIAICSKDDGSNGRMCDPWEADEFTRDAVKAVNLMHALIKAGCGSDESVNGADIVDLINEHLTQ